VNSTVSLEAERELIDGALFYAREASAELGLTFIAEFERSLGVTCSYPRLGPVWRGTTRRFPLRRSPSSTRSNPRRSESSRSLTRAAALGTGVLASDAPRPGLARLSPNPRFDPTRSGGLRLPTRACQPQRSVSKNLASGA
jgi:hypothetical protein